MADSRGLEPLTPGSVERRWVPLTDRGEVTVLAWHGERPSGNEQAAARGLAAAREAGTRRRGSVENRHLSR